MHVISTTTGMSDFTFWFICAMGAVALIYGVWSAIPPRRQPRHWN